MTHLTTHSEKVIERTNRLIDEALHLTKDPLLCIRIAIYINGEATRTIEDTIHMVSMFDGLSDENKYKFMRLLDDMEQERVDVYVELYNRFQKMNQDENNKN